MHGGELLPAVVAVVALLVASVAIIVATLVDGRLRRVQRRYDHPGDTSTSRIGLSMAPWWDDLSDDDLFAALVAEGLDRVVAAGLVWHREVEPYRTTIAGHLGWATA